MVQSQVSKSAFVSVHKPWFVKRPTQTLSKLKTVKCSMELLKIHSETPQSEPKSVFHLIQPLRKNKSLQAMY